MIQAKQDRLKREQSKPEHKAPKHYVEVATSDSTGYRNPVLSQARGSPISRRSDSPGGRVRVQRIGKGGFANPAVPVLWCPRKEQLNLQER